MRLPDRRARISTCRCGCALFNAYVLVAEPQDTYVFECASCENSASAPVHYESDDYGLGTAIRQSKHLWNVNCVSSLPLYTLRYVKA